MWYWYELFLMGITMQALGLFIRFYVFRDGK
jgi:hypothetical protein